MILKRSPLQCFYMLPTASRHLLWLLLIIVSVIITRVCIIVWFSALTPGGLAGVLAGHDGVDYLAYADAVSRFDLASIPDSARRVNPGWPFLIGTIRIALPFVPVWVIAWVLMTASFAGALLLYDKMLTRLNFDASARLRAVFAFGFAYPTLLYFQSFALVDSILLLLIIACMCAWQSKRFVLSAVLLSCATCVRLPVFLLGIAQLAADFYFHRSMGTKREQIRRVVLLGLALVLPGLLLLLCKSVWGSSTIGLYSPKIGLPLSGLDGISEVSTIRALYILLAVSFFVVSAIIYVRRFVSSQRTPFNLFASIYTVFFILFHLSLKRLLYEGSMIPLFNYQDRYYVALLPFCLLPWLRFLSWRVLMVLTGVSIVLTCYWGKNYFHTLLALTN
ncbi:hypothetical protein GX645_03500 [Candidatus Sumerlaeota bacterium]|nr:hypothetical protein [Candidatus Sumerlaeota bacterium]